MLQPPCSQCTAPGQKNLSKPENRLRTVQKQYFYRPCFTFFTLFANTLDFWILRKYLQCFSHKRKLGHYQRVILFVSCVLLLSAANFYGNPNVNLLFSFAIIYLYSFSFSYSCLYHVVMPILYIGLGFVSEPIGFLLTRRLGGLYFSRDVILYLCVYM